MASGEDVIIELPSLPPLVNPIGEPTSPGSRCDYSPVSSGSKRRSPRAKVRSPRGSPSSTGPDGINPGNITINISKQDNVNISPSSELSERSLPKSKTVFSLELGSNCVNPSADCYDDPSGECCAQPESTDRSTYHLPVERRCCRITRGNLLLTVTAKSEADSKVLAQWQLAPVRHRDLYKLYYRIARWADADETGRLRDLYEPFRKKFHSETLYASFRELHVAESVVNFLNEVAKNPHLCCCDSLLEFLELAPNSNLQANPISYSNDVEGSPRHAALKEHMLLSKSFNKDLERVTTREGYCYKLNTNSIHSLVRRTYRILGAVLIWLIMYSLTALICQVAWNAHTDSSTSLDSVISPGDSWSEFALGHLPPFLVAVLSVIFWIAGPEFCPAAFRKLPAAKLYRVWLRLTDNELSYYFKHTNVADFANPEGAVLLLLPNTKVIAQQNNGQCSGSCVFGCYFGGCLCNRPTLAVVTPNETLVLRFKTRAACAIWEKDINAAIGQRLQAATTPVNFGASSSLLVPSDTTGAISRFDMGAFAPVRQAQRACWFVDGQDTFAAIRHSLEGAEQEVLIAGWMLSAEVLLGREQYSGAAGENGKLEVGKLKDSIEEGFVNPEIRACTLAEILLKLARRDVKVRIMIYKELELALPNASKNVADILTNLHPNIRILRHPFGISLWSHHEKLVIIDQAVAFIGGIDLAFGRYDTQNHSVGDVNTDHFPGKDFYNPRLAPFGHLDIPYQDPGAIDRTRHPRMAWHDVHTCVVGSAALDAALHFIQRWNNHSKEALIKIENNASLKGAEREEPNKHGLEECRHMLEELREQEEQDLELLQDLEITIAELEAATPDSHVYSSALNRRNLCLFRNNKTRCCGKSYEVQEELLMQFSQSQHKQFVEKHLEHLKPELAGTNGGNGHGVQCQVLRSACSWSLGTRDELKEASIHTAYIEAIANAQHFIYIENQFFISNTANEPACALGANKHMLERSQSVAADDLTVEQAVHQQPETASTGGKVHNQIADALAIRIIQAINAGERFCVLLVIPNFPEGSVTDQAVQSVLHFQLRTLSGTGKSADGHRGVSLVERVKHAAETCGRKGVKWWDYLVVSCLRNHTMFGGRDGYPVIEQVYVHSKLIIVDDRIVICGSANINDRSMCGDRDSEVCLKTWPGDEVDSKMNGEDWRVSTYAQSLRLSLWAEHLGFDDRNDHENVYEMFADPLRKEAGSTLYGVEKWKVQAYRNTKDCMSNFKEQPSNEHPSVYEYDSKRKESDEALNKWLEQELINKRDFDLSASPTATPRSTLSSTSTPRSKDLYNSWMDKVDAVAPINFTGHVCEFPLKFLSSDLKDKRLLPDKFTSERMVPVMTFT